MQRCPQRHSHAGPSTACQAQAEFQPNTRSNDSQDVVGSHTIPATVNHRARACFPANHELSPQRTVGRRTVGSGSPRSSELPGAVGLGTTGTLRQPLACRQLQAGELAGGDGGPRTSVRRDRIPGGQARGSSRPGRARSGSGQSRVGRAARRPPPQLGQRQPCQLDANGGVGRGGRRRSACVGASPTPPSPHYYGRPSRKLHFPEAACRYRRASRQWTRLPLTASARRLWATALASADKAAGLTVG
jgi:hypothetical protein